VLRALQVHKEQRVHKAHRALQEQLVILDHRVIQALKVHKVPQEL
jgi:hypothetical protein